MRPVDDELAAVHSFADFVREYVGLVDQDPDREVDMRALARLISNLISAGFALPDLDEDSPDLETSSSELARFARVRFRSLASIVYREIADPFAGPTQECVAGSLLDDLQTIYSDLKQSLTFYDAGYVRAASRDWRFNFTFHWGEHATSAVRALYWLLRHNG
jgi:hypothetical protein